MSRAADKLRADGARFKRPTAAAPVVDEDAPRPDDDPVVPTAPTARTRPFRRSVDLPPARHFALERWCQETGEELGFKVTGMAVMNVLVKELLTNETLARQIRKDVELRPEPRKSPRK